MISVYPLPPVDDVPAIQRYFEGRVIEYAGHLGHRLWLRDETPQPLSHQQIGRLLLFNARCRMEGIQLHVEFQPPAAVQCRDLQLHRILFTTAPESIT